MSSFRVLNTFMLASAWLLTVFGATPCTIPWYNDESPPLSEISGFCVPKGDREACRHASLLPASSGGCPATPAESGRGMIEQECCVAITCGAARILPQGPVFGLAGPEPNFCLSPLQATVKKSEGLGYQQYRDAICLGAKPTVQDSLICCSLLRPTKPDDTCGTDQELVESCKNFPSDPCCRRLCPDPIRLEQICKENPNDSCCTHLCPVKEKLDIICKYYPNDQCCQPGQPTPQQHPDISSPVQNGVPVTNEVSPKDSWMQDSLENRWQYRQDNLDWDGGRVIKNPVVHDGQMSREPCPSWKQLFQLC